MWPFRGKSTTGLSGCAAGGSPTAVRCELTVVSPDAMTSPVTSARGVAFWVELLEQLALSQVQDADEITSSALMSNQHTSLGSITLGDLLVLRDDDGAEVTISVGRARFVFVTQSPSITRLPDKVPSELVPLLRAASGLGVPCYREQTIRAGDRFRLDATVEAVRVVTASGYRSDVGTSFVVRDELAPVVLEEILETPDW